MPTRPPRRLKTLVALAAFSTILAFYAGEFFLILLDRWSPTTLTVMDARVVAGKRIRAIQQLRRQGTEAHPALAPHFLLEAQPDGTLHSPMVIEGVETLPLGGIARVPTVFCSEGGRYRMYDSDEHGFHNPPGIWEKPRLDVLAVGDSFTQGVCVPSESNMVARIRERYPDTLNVGSVGNGPLMELATLKEYGPAFSPKRVLWFYYEVHDISQNLAMERRSPLLMRYLLDETFSQGLRARQVPIDRHLIDYSEARMRATIEAAGHGTAQALGDFILLRHVRVLVGLVRREPEPPPREDDMTLFRDILRRAQQITASWGGQLYLVYLPSWQSAARRSPDYDAMRQRIISMARSLKLPVIDVHRAFQAQRAPREMFACWWCHYNEAGYRVAAQAVLDALQADAP